MPRWGKTITIARLRTIAVLGVVTGAAGCGGTTSPSTAASSTTASSSTPLSATPSGQSGSPSTSTIPGQVTTTMTSSPVIYKWETQSVPHLTGTLLAVSCASATTCVAVGQNENGSTPVALADEDGNWNVLPVPAGVTSLTGISCISSADCLAVGSGPQGGVAVQLLSSRWVQRWAISDESHLNSVSCTDQANCIAVGTPAGTNSDDVFQFNGSSWTPMALPSLFDGVTPNRLSGVSCSSATTCVAVGVISIGVILQYSGDTWSLSYPTPSSNGTLSTYDEMNSVSCPALNFCAAVGSFIQTQPGMDNLMFDGSQWTGAVFMGTDTSAVSQDTTMTGVSCPTSTDCVALGFDAYLANNTSGSGDVVFHYRGSSWSVLSAPALPPLTSVSCPTVQLCVAVGTTSGGNVAVVDAS